MSDQRTELQAIFDRIEAGNRLSKQDLQTLVAAVRSQQVTIATGDRAVAIGGSADGAVIVTGDRNLVITGANADAIRELLGKRPRNEKLLLKAVQEEVASRLKQSLHNAVLIQLGMEAQPSQVKRPWDSDIKIGDKPLEAIPASMSILEVFDQPDIAGKLLILGNPGAGKTTTMLELGKGLIARAEQDVDFPIAVLFNLSNWEDSQLSIHDWLIAELKSRPFCNIPERISQKLFQEKRLLPLLDGLDELSSERQELCVKAINQFVNHEHSPQYLVVCSRGEEYSNYTEQLKLNGAIYLRNLTNEQVQAYFSQVKRTDLWEVLQKDKTLLNLVHTPFWLSILVLSSQELQIGDYSALGSTEAQLTWLLDSYMRQMFARQLKNDPYNKQEPTPEKAESWLIWIAQRLSQNSQTEFLIESLQPYHLQNKNLQRNYQMGIKLGIDLGVGVLFGIFITFTENLLSGFFTSALTAWAVDRKIEFYQEIQVVERFSWSWSRAKTGIRVILFAVLVVFPFFIFLFLYVKSESNLLLSALFFIGFLTCVGLGSGFSGSELEDSYIPNQGIWKSVAISSGFALIGGLLFGTILSVGISINSRIDNWLVTISGTTILLGVILGLNFGGHAVIQHFILRLVLYSNGSIPWNYAKFLDYCKERMFLQQVGGRYRFVHRLLQEHFAAMPLKRE
jgi:hypothetical protein